MDRCFVIQPFDRGAFDKRFDDVLAPAIREAGLEAYRVDRDPGADILIAHIESGIRESRVCVAEITSDNPNVWYELGFAFAARKDVVLVASRTRAKFPFDVQHRHVIGYAPESSSDFLTLKTDITIRLKAVLEKQDKLSAVSTPVADGTSAGNSGNTIGLSAHEMAALVVIGTESLNGGSVVYSEIKMSMSNAGFTDAAVAVATKSLIRRKLVREDYHYSSFPDEDEGPPTTVYKLMSDGEDWMLANQDKLVLRVPWEDRPL